MPAPVVPPVAMPEPPTSMPPNIEPPAFDQPFKDAFADMDKQFNVPAPEPPAPAPAPEPPKEPAAPEPPQEPAEPQEPTEPPKEPEKPAPEPVKPPVKAAPVVKSKEPADLRREYNELKKRHNELIANNEKLKDDPEKKALADRLTERDKRIAELDQTVKFSAYERSEEFNEKYQKPFVDAFQSARARAAAMKVNDGEDGMRPGTAEDFDKVMSVQDPEQAAALVEEMYGTGAKATTIINLREKVIDLNEKQQGALEEYQKSFADRQKADTEKAETHRTQTAQLWEGLNKHAIESHPELFGPEEGDEKGNELLQQGYQRADLAFAGDPSMPHQKVVALHSEIRNKAAAFPRLVHQKALLAARVTELEKELEQFKQSEPAQPEGVPAPEGGDQSWESSLDGIAKPSFH